MAYRLLTGLVLTCGVGSAQAIVNVENMRVGPAQQGLSGQANVSLSGKNGNTNKTDHSLDGRLQWQQGRVTDFVVLAYDLGTTNDVRNLNKTFVHGRHMVQFAPTQAWEAFLQAEQNEFSRLSLRALGGAGWRVTLSEHSDRALHLGAGAMAVRERLEPRSGLTDHGTDQFARANLYLSYKHKLNDQVSLISTTYYQPRLGDVTDYRALEQAALAVRMTDRLGLKVSLDIVRDSRPPQAVRSTDVAYKTSLSYSF